VLRPREIVEGTLHSAGRAARLAEHGAAALLAVHVARALHGRWRRLTSSRRRALEPLAEDVKERALDLRGAADRARAGRELNQANERLAQAMVESDEVEVDRLRQDLALELDRLANADIRASRGPGRDSALAEGEASGGESA
jgi:hypothetical protein